MAGVILLCGKIASGKTTYANRIRQDTDAIILSCDELMLTLFDGCLGDKHDDMVSRIHDYFCKIALQILSSGQDVVFDFGYWTKLEREHVRNFFNNHNIPCSLHYVTIPEDVRLARLAERNGLLLNATTRQFIIHSPLRIKLDEKFEPPQDADKIISEV